MRFSKAETDGVLTGRYHRRMANPPIDKQWMRAAIREAGYRSQETFADEVGLTGPKFTNVLKGIRKLSLSEIEAMAIRLRRSLPEVRQALGLGGFTETPQPLAGYVAAADQVILFDGPDEGVEMATVHVPFLFYPGSLLQIRGESMAPRYKPGEIIGVRMNLAENGEIDRLIGEDVVTYTRDGQTLLKRLEEGEREDRYTLLSVNPLVAPILNAALKWAVPIDLHLPKPARS